MGAWGREWPPKCHVTQEEVYPPEWNVIPEGVYPPEWNIILAKLLNKVGHIRKSMKYESLNNNQIGGMNRSGDLRVI